MNNKEQSLTSFQTKLNHHILELSLYNQYLNQLISKSSYKQLISNINQTDNKEIFLNKNDSSIKNQIKQEWNMNIPLSQSKPLKYHQHIHYSFQPHSINKWTHKMDLFLFYAFLSMHSLISKPIIETTPDKVIIHLFFYILKPVHSHSQFMELNQVKFKWLSTVLSQLWSKPVELDLVRLHYSYFDSHIFVNLFNVLINQIQLRTMMQTFFKKAIIQNPFKILNALFLSSNISLISGIQFRIGGRLMTQKIVPRQTVKIIRKGSLSRGKWDYLDKARFIHKNRRGAYSLTLSIGHSFNKMNIISSPF